MIPNMTYSHDLRIKTLNYIEKGGSKIEASYIFGVMLRALFHWTQAKEARLFSSKPEEAA